MVFTCSFGNNMKVQNNCFATHTFNRMNESLMETYFHIDEINKGCMTNDEVESLRENQTKIVTNKH